MHLRTTATARTSRETCSSHRAIGPRQRWHVIGLCALAIGSTALSLSAHADLIGEVNAIRRQGCDGKPGLSSPLKQTKGLDAVANEWSKGGRLRDAVERAQYRVVNSASMRISGVKTDAAARNILVKNYCETILNAEFTEAGSVRRDGEVWLVLAKPFAESPMQEIAVIRQRALILVNQARAKARKCGPTSFGPAPPLVSAGLLDQAAQLQATDMAMHNFFAHEGSDGTHPSDRITRVGYKWRAVAENIAAGYREIDPVIQGWIDSPGHCANIMNPAYTQMGIAYAANPKSEAGVYWSQTFGRPR